MGYRYDAPTQLYKLDDATRLSPTFDDKIAKIGCDLILALEDLDFYVVLLKMGPIDPIVHFSSRVQQLQQNYQPAELQYPPNPIVPPRLPHQPNYPGEPFREEMQNTYANMPERSQQSQGNTGWNNPEPGRPDTSMVNDQYSGIHQGKVALTNQRYPDQSNQQPYPEQGYVKHDPYRKNQQTDPEYETKGYPRQQNPQMIHGQDPRDVQGPHYTTELNYNTNPGNPRAQGQHSKSDPYAQQPNTQDRMYATNYPRVYNQQMNQRQDPQSRNYAPKREPNPYAQYQPERYLDHTANHHITDPMHNPITDHERPGAYTHPQPGQDTRFPQNPGIHSSSPRGAPSPSVTPKSTHERNEQTLVKTGSEGAFQTKAFGRSGSSHLHGIDEKKHSHEHELSGVKEQGDNNPRQQLPMPGNHSGKKDASELQTANTQQLYRQYEMLYGETVNPPRNYNHPHPPNPGNDQLPMDNSDSPNDHKKDIICG